MASKEMTKRDADENDLGLSSKQIIALERLTELGAAAAEPDETGRSVYDSRPQVRAYQLIYEGRFAGRGNGQGRPRKPRAAELLAEHIREHFPKKMERALKRALSEEAGSRANLDAIRLAIDIERGERKLQIEEEEHDGNLGNTREELIATLFALVGEPATAAAIEGSAEEIPEA